MHILASKNIDFSKSTSYNPVVKYAESKLANVLHIVELQRLYGYQGIKTYSLHPGCITSTELNRDQKYIESLLMAPLSLISKTIEQGAMTTLYCALSDEALPGHYHSNCRVAQSSYVAYSWTKAKELWVLSEKIIKEKTK